MRFASLIAGSIFHSLATSLVSNTNDMEMPGDGRRTSGSPEKKKETERLIEYLDKHFKKSGSKNRLSNPLKPTSLAVDLKVSLPHGSFTFFSSSNPSPLSPQIPFIELNFSKFTTNYTLLSDYESFAVTTKLEGFEANEIRQNGQVSRIISRQDEDGDNTNLFEVMLQNNPTDKPGFDYAVVATLEQLHFSVSPSLTTLKEFKKFLPPSSSSLKKSNPTTPSSTFYDTLNKSSLSAAHRHLKQKAKLTLSQHKNLYVDVNFHAPIITIAADASTLEASTSIVIDLGNVHLFNGRMAGLKTPSSTTPSGWENVNVTTPKVRKDEERKTSGAKRRQHTAHHYD